MRRQFLKCSIICLSAMGALCDALTSQAPNAEVLATGVVEGIVRGPLGEPMPNAEVLATRGFRGSDVIARTRSDGTGMFVIGGLAADGSYEMQAKVDGYTVSSVPVELTAERREARAELRVYEANTVRGRVIDDSGEPVAGAFVLATADYANLVGGLVPQECTTDEEGRFELDAVPIGSSVVRAYSPGFEMRQYWLDEVDDVEVELRLLRRSGAHMEIRIYGLAADVLGDVLLYTNPRCAMPRVLEQLRPDEQGVATMTGLPRMTWNVRPELAGHVFDPPVWRAAGPVDEHAPRFTVVKDDAYTLFGDLRDLDGAAIGRQRLRVLSRDRRPVGEIVVGEDGVFETNVALVRGQPFRLVIDDSAWVLLPAARQQLWDSRPGEWTGVADDRVEVGVALRAVPAAKVAVQVVDGSGRPAPFQTVTLQVEHPLRGWMPRAHTTTGRDGRGVFSQLVGTGDDRRVRVEGTLGAGASDVFEVRAAAVEAVEVVLAEAGSVVGRVVRSGEPVGGVCVSFAEIDFRGTKLVRSAVLADRAGRFAFPAVVAGKAVVGVGALRQPSWSKPFEVTPGRQSDVEIVVSK